jgi:autotransporter-associated beta strand protein
MKTRTLLAGLSFFLLTFNAAAFSALTFWDTNGTADGSGGPTPIGTWGADAYWNEDASGGAATGGPKAWSDGNYAVFAAGDDATGEYTVFVSNIVKVADIHVDLGQVTFDPDPDSGGAFQMAAWQNAELTNNVNRLLSAGHKSDSVVVHYNVALNGAHNLIRYKRGVIILAATNTYTGSTTIEGGVLQLGGSHVLPEGVPLVLANNDPARGDFNELWRYTSAVLAADGFSQSFGPLRLSGSDFSVERALDFGQGTSTLAFADSSAEDWNFFPLTLRNYTPGADQLRFGTSASGLTTAQLSQIQFDEFLNLPAQIDAQGYVTPALPVLQTPVRLSGTAVELTWSAVSGRTYRAQYKDNLEDSNWTDLSPDVWATEATASYTDITAATAHRYYRVILPF